MLKMAKKSRQYSTKNDQKVRKSPIQTKESVRFCQNFFEKLGEKSKCKFPDFKENRVAFTYRKNLSNCSKVSVSIPTCPRPSGWSLLRATPKSASPSNRRRPLPPRPPRLPPPYRRPTPLLYIHSQDVSIYTLD